MTTRPVAPRAASVRLSVAMIVRDCAEPLAATLDCVQNLADEIVIVDTGSGDKTREFSSKRATRVLDFAWSDDFSAARNAALDYVTGDWVLWLDAGETMRPETQAALRKFLDESAADNTAYLLLIDMPGQDADAPHEQAARMRLHPRREDLNWFGRVREQLRYDPQQGELRVEQAPGIIERGTREIDPATRRLRAERNLRLADLEQLGMGPSARIELVRAEALSQMEQPEPAGAAYRRAVGLAARGSTEALDAYYGWLTIYDQWPERRNEQLAIAAAALDQFPLDAQLLCATGNYLQAQGRYDLAARSYQAASEHGSVNIETWHLENIAEVTTNCWAVALEHLGQRDRALEIVQGQVAQPDASRRIIRQLLDMYIVRGQRAAALELLPRLTIAVQDRDALRSAIRGACLAAKQQWSQAISYLQMAWSAGCRDIICLRWYCTTLFALDSADQLHAVLSAWDQLGIHLAELQKFASVCLTAIKTTPQEQEIRIDAGHPIQAPALSNGFVPQEASLIAMRTAW
jgi:tetratricopeptide (TPR) repeat protein